ncbi:GDSL-type esterase/lipase family protein [Methylobacterium sp. NEAU K]|uniref:GDSL-type esterase/lipase family protein n=1 Tax=Methylobacterium sp. NEAU K TaxID=3064946 RepID=UPI002733AD4B|nr:GDSL-type esterase/lipase family protein [Methylobacterium sp. NEAU K]MDP4004166.1 GDSL-type esterase/lipase family protein [Methylobacterium sp. NEAU K]
MGSGQDRPLVFIGDSITAAWGAYRAETFARHGFVARGIPGQTSGQIRARFLRDAAGARGIHLLCGINDIAEIDGRVSDMVIRDNIAAMARLAFEAGLPLWIGTVMPSDFGGWRPELRPVARIRALNAWIRAHCAASAAALIDYHAPLATAAGALRPDVTEDGIHLTAAGYATIEPALLAALAPADAAPPGR